MATIRKQLSTGYQVLGDGRSFRVVGPNGRVYVFDNPYDAREAAQRMSWSDTPNKMFPSNKVNSPKWMKIEEPEAKQADDMPNEYPTSEDYNAGGDADEYNKNKGYRETIDYVTDKLHKQHAVIKELTEKVGYAPYPNPAAGKIQAEIDRIEAQIAKSGDLENKEKMTTYVAGLHKALKLIQ